MTEQSNLKGPDMTKGKTILVVDDESDIRIFLGTMLEDAGFNVITAADGDEALREIKKQKPDLISLDLVMPKKSGIKFLYELRHNREWSKIPVIVVTGHARDEKVRKEMDETFAGKTFSGPQAYLEKPIKPTDFVKIVKRELGIQDEESGDGISQTDDLRKQVKELAEVSDPDILKDVLQLLREKKK